MIRLEVFFVNFYSKKNKINLEFKETDFLSINNKKIVSLCRNLFMVSECKNRVMLTVYLSHSYGGLSPGTAPIARVFTSFTGNWPSLCSKSEEPRSELYRLAHIPLPHALCCRTSIFSEVEEGFGSGQPVSSVEEVVPH